MTVAQDTYVTIEYTFSAPDGSVLGSSEYSGPFTFRQGSGDAVPGLDSRIDGARVGEPLSFVIPPEEGYGLRDESKVRRLAKDALPLGREPEVGMRVNTGSEIMTITAVEPDHIVLDGNHPLAGVALHFEVRVTDISDSDPAESGCGCGGTCGCGGH